MIIPEHWCCLTDEGNTFYTELAKKYQPIFESTEEPVESMIAYLKEGVAFEATPDGLDADVTKEVQEVVYLFVSDSLKRFNVTEEQVNELYWEAYYNYNFT